MRMLARISIFVFVLLPICVAANAQIANGAPAETVTVIRAGTLIDGTSNAARTNQIIIIRGNRIAAVGRAGQVQVPAGAQTINAAGKWIIPGLMDAKSNYYGYYGEGYLIWGVTSAFNSGGGGMGTDTLSGIENIWGSNYNDVLTGDAGNNTFYGSGGNNTFDGGTGDERRADLDALALAEHQHAVERYGLTDFGREQFDLYLLAGFDAVLLAAGLDHCIHGWSCR